MYYIIHFLQVHLRYGCPIPMVDIISSTNCYFEARAWSMFYANWMQTFVHLMGVNTSYVDLGID